MGCEPDTLARNERDALEPSFTGGWLQGGQEACAKPLRGSVAERPPLPSALACPKELSLVDALALGPSMPLFSFVCRFLGSSRGAWPAGPGGFAPPLSVV